MAYQVTSNPALETVQRIKSGAIENWIKCDGATDLFSVASKVPENNSERLNCNGTREKWTGETTYAQALEMCLTGDLSLVARSDELMSKFENLMPINTSKFRIIDDVAGGAPNVPNYLAGVPLTMRRRQRIASDMAPLTIVVDTATSQGITASQIERKGIATLALTRLLAIRRPVQLYIGCTVGNGHDARHSNCILTAIDSAPLDLARAAYLMTNPAVARGLSYAALTNEFEPQGSGGNIPWGYQDAELERRTAAERYSRFIGSDVLYIAAAHAKDKSLNDPETWLKDMLAQYGGELMAA